MNPPPTFADVQRAALLLRDVAHLTPIQTSSQLDRVSNATVFLKCENFQRVGAFKFRGAYHAVALAQAPGPIIAVSSGNHAQGIALACRLLGLEAHLVMPKPVNPLKLAAVKAYGGLVYSPDHRVAGDEFGLELRDRLQGILIPAFDDPHVIAGQGTAALEFMEQVTDLDVLLAPIGGGGLTSGTCLAVHGVRPQVRVFACEPAGALDAMFSVEHNRVVPQSNPRTIADGLRTSIGELSLAVLREHLAGFFVVEEFEIVEAMRFVYERLKLVIEPSSAVAVAPLLRQEPALLGKKVGVIISGGNVDLSEFFGSLQNATS